MMRLLGPLRKRLLNRRPYILAGEIARSLQQLKSVETRMVTLPARGAERGRVLLSYIIEPFLLPPDSPVRATHTHYWESQRIAELWAEAGYTVDIIHWTNRRFVPQRRYDFAIDVRHNLERLAPLLNPDCVRILHIETSHWLFHTAAQHNRLLDLQRRRGVTLPPSKLVLPNLGIEHADCATILGNHANQETFGYAKKPMYRIPISAPMDYPWPESKDFDAVRRRFLWIGSSGFVHKGLDLALEAFVAMPDFHLTICGPLKSEPDFTRVYQRELFATENIAPVGWVDVTSDVFTRIAASCIGLIYPSCSEGCTGIAVNCMHVGLIPVLSYQSGVDVAPERGVILDENSIPAIQAAVRAIAARPTSELAAMARASWEFARANHTKAQFAAAYQSFIGQMLADHDQLIRTRAQPATAARAAHVGAAE